MRHFTHSLRLIEAVLYFLVAISLGFVAPTLPVNVYNATSSGSSLAPGAASQKDACTNSSSELHGWHRTVHKGHGSTSRSCPCWPSLGQHLGGTCPLHFPRQHDGRTSQLVVLALPPVQQVKCPILSHLWEEVDSELRCRGPHVERMVREYGEFSGPVASSQGSLTCSISPSIETETAVQAAQFPGQRQGQGTAAWQGQDEGQGSLQRQEQGRCQGQRARCPGHAAGDTLAATCHAHARGSGCCCGTSATGVSDQAKLVKALREAQSQGASLPTVVTDILARVETVSSRQATKNIHAQTAQLGQAKGQITQLRQARSAQARSWANYIAESLQALEKGAAQHEERMSKFRELESLAIEKAKAAQNAIEVLSKAV